MKVTSDLMEAFVHCRYKAFLRCTGQVGSATEYELLGRRQVDAYQEKAIQWLTERYSPREIAHDLECLENARKGRHRLLLNLAIIDDGHSIIIPAIERLASGRRSDYAVLWFWPGNKLVRPTKLSAALLATALGATNRFPVSCAKVVFGPQFCTARLGLSSPNASTHLGNEAKSILRDLETMVTMPVAPKLFLNAHCNICEFRERCRKEATEKENLSLLAGLQPKEIEAWNERGIFTVTQLAHTFRPKTMGRSSAQPKRHSQQLQAMAIRDKTTYVRKRPEMPAAATKVYLDVEGIPDTGLFYLIGIVVVNGTDQSRLQFWADTESDQEAMWREFLAALKQLNDYVVVHFGRYEKDFVQEMIQRYGRVSEQEPLPRLFDVHAALRTNVFFPVFSNSLKEIAAFLGFHWQGPVRSGIDSIVWRYKWEEDRDATAREDLLRYNYEDCLAAMTIYDWFATLGSTAATDASVCLDICNAPTPHRGEFGSKGLSLSAIGTIFKCAYFKYQQNRVFFRTDKNVRRSVQRQRRTSRARIRANQVITCTMPQQCPKCGSHRLTNYHSHYQAKIVRDVKFMRGGVKRWVIKYETSRCQCLHCGHTSYSAQYPTRQSKS